MYLQIIVDNYAKIDCSDDTIGLTSKFWSSLRSIASGIRCGPPFGSSICKLPEPWKRNTHHRLDYQVPCYTRQTINNFNRRCNNTKLNFSII